MTNSYYSLSENNDSNDDWYAQSLENADNEEARKQDQAQFNESQKLERQKLELQQQQQQTQQIMVIGGIAIGGTLVLVVAIFLFLKLLKGNKK